MREFSMIGARHSMRIALVALLAAGLAGCGVFGGKGGPKTPTVGERIPILSRIESGAQVDPELAGVAVILPTEEANADWAQPGGTASKSYGHLALAASPSRVWTATVGGSGKKQRLAAAPVVANGTVYAMGTDGLVSAFSASNGAKLWSTSFGVSGDGENTVFGGGVSFDSGRVYVATGYGEVAALEADSGKQVWKVKPAGPLRGSPTVAFNSVYVMTQNNQIHALNAADGAPLWTESGAIGQAGVFGVAAPAAGQGTVIAGYSSGELSAYRYENGRTLVVRRLGAHLDLHRGGEPDRRRCRSDHRSRPGLRAGAGWAHGGLRSRNRAAHLGT
jgi:outer membrane protein assembly factor BamB